MSVANLSRHSRVSSSSRRDSLSKRVKFTSFEFLLGHNEVNFKGFGICMLVFEILGYLSIIAYQCSLFIEHEFVLWKYICLLSNPLGPVEQLVPYSIVFVVCCVIVLIPLGCFVYYYYFPDNEGTFYVSFFSGRLIRTVGWIPLLTAFSSAFQFTRQDGAFLLKRFGGASVLDFPYIMYLIFGALGLLVLLVLCGGELLLNLDKFRGIKNLTASSDGIFQFCAFFVNFIYVLLTSIFRGRGSYNALGIINCIQFTATIIVLVALIRYLPYYSKLFNIFLCVAYSILATGHLVAFLYFFTSGDPYSFVSLSVLTVFLCLGVSLLLVRYYLMHKLFKDRIFYNLFLCYFSHDVALIFYLTKKKISTIDRIIKDIKFQKSQKICQMLISILVENNVVVANQILKHAKSISRGSSFSLFSFIDDFILYFYSRKIINMQQKGTFGSLKVTKELTSIRKCEMKLKKLYMAFFSVFLEEEVSFAKIPALFTTIMVNMEYCEKKYQKLISMFPSEKVMRRYADFCVRFKNDQETSERFFNEAKSMNSGASALDPTMTRVGDEDRSFSVESVRKTTSTLSTSSGQSASGEQIFEMENVEELDNNGRSSSPSTPQQQQQKKSHHGVSEDDLHNMQEKMSNYSVATSNTFKKSTTSSSTHSEYTVMDKYIKSKTTVSSGLSFVVLALLFIIVVAVAVLIFYLAKSSQERMESSGQLIEDISRARIEAINVVHYMRKVQIAELGDNSSIIDFAFERNSSVWVNRLHRSCDDLLVVVRDLYQRSSEEQRKVWKKSFPFDSSNVLDGDFVIEVSLYDGVLHLADQCMYMLDEHTGDNEMFDNIENEEKYILIQKNEPLLYSGLTEAQQSIIDGEIAESTSMKVLFTVIPNLILLFSVVVGVYGIFAYFQERSSFKGLLLIPKKHYAEKYEFFGGVRDRETNSSSDASLKLSTPIPKLFLYTLFFYMVGAWICFVAFTPVGIATSNRFVARNAKLDYAQRVEVDARRIHMHITNLMFYKSSIKEEERYLFENAHPGNSDPLDFVFSAPFRVLYEDLRFGKPEIQLPSLDEDKAVAVVLHQDSCDSDDFEEESEKLSCFSLNRLINTFVESVEAIHVGMHMMVADPYYLDEESQKEMAKDYEKMRLLDDCEEIQDGIMHQKLHQAHYIIEHEVDSLYNALYTLSLLVLTLALPVLVLVFALLFYGFTKKINSYLLLSRRIMLSFPRSVITQKHVMDFILSKSRFEKLFENKREKQNNDMMNALEHSTYNVIVFDEKLRIIRANHAAKDLFKIRGQKLPSLKLCLAEGSVDDVRKWIKETKSSSRSFNGELFAMYDEREFPVLFDISRTKKNQNSFIAIIDDIENSKRKKILEQVESRTQKFDALLCNMLPENIASRMKVSVEGGLTNMEKIVCVHKCVTATFIDLVDFSKFSKESSPETVLGTIDEIFSKFDDLCDESGVEKIKTIGDCCVPTYDPDHAMSTMNFCVNAMKWLRTYNEENARNFEVRIGVASGECIAGIIGKRKWCYDVWGSTINEAARMESYGIKGKIQISRSTYELVFDKFDNWLERSVVMQGYGLVKTYVLTVAHDKNEIIQNNCATYISPCASQSFDETETYPTEEEAQGVPVSNRANTCGHFVDEDELVCEEDQKKLAEALAKSLSDENKTDESGEVDESQADGKESHVGGEEGQGGGEEKKKEKEKRLKKGTISNSLSPKTPKKKKKNKKKSAKKPDSLHKTTKF